MMITFFSFSSNVGVTLQKARRRVEHNLTRIGFGKSRRQIISREATPGELLFKQEMKSIPTFLISIFPLKKKNKIKRSESTEFARNGWKWKRNVCGHSQGKENGFRAGDLRRNASIEFSFGSLSTRDHTRCQPHRCRSRFGK